MNNSGIHIPHELKPSSVKTIFIAISGGVDSAVLLDVFSKNYSNIHLLHVNYHLRGEDSNADEQLIRNLAAKYTISISVLDFNMDKHLSDNGGNLQNEARKIRYDFFSQHVSAEDIFMTAHHLDDQMETFFMHLTRKSGIVGLSCMAEKNGNHWRPLLSFRKSDLYRYAEENQLEFREDRSNKENKYIRNRWRNEWIPMMEKANTQLAESIQILVKAFQKERDLLEKENESTINSIRKYSVWTFDSFDKTNEEGRYLIAKKLGLRASEFEELSALRNTDKSKKLEVNREKLVIWNDRDSFIFSKEKAMEIPELIVESIVQLPESFDKKSIYLDSDKISGKLRIRKWCNGDRIFPVGMEGSQLVSDIIKDGKISAQDKAQVLVVEDDEEIVWVIGLKIGGRKIASMGNAKITKATIFGHITNLRD